MDVVESFAVSEEVVDMVEVFICCTPKTDVPQDPIMWKAPLVIPILTPKL